MPLQASRFSNQYPENVETNSVYSTYENYLNGQEIPGNNQEPLLAESPRSPMRSTAKFNSIEIHPDQEFTPRQSSYPRNPQQVQVNELVSRLNQERHAARPKAQVGKSLVNNNRISQLENKGSHP